MAALVTPCTSEHRAPRDTVETVMVPYASAPAVSFDTMNPWSPLPDHHSRTKPVVTFESLYAISAKLESRGVPSLVVSVKSMTNACQPVPGSSLTSNGDGSAPDAGATTRSSISKQRGKYGL